jgi:hypothetical protein
VAFQRPERGKQLTLRAQRHPVRLPLGQEAMRQGQRSLGFAAACQILNGRKHRPSWQRHGLRPLLDM